MHIQARAYINTCILKGRQTDRQPNRQTDKGTDRQTDKQTGTYINKDGQVNKQVERNTGKIQERKHETDSTSIIER